jgi:hypothetical protein
VFNSLSVRAWPRLAIFLCPRVAELELAVAAPMPHQDHLRVLRHPLHREDDLPTPTERFLYRQHDGHPPLEARASGWSMTKA